jgi:hypothetical protein
MPGKSAQVKNEKQYEALKDKGMSKERAAKIASSPDASRKAGKQKPVATVPKMGPRRRGRRRDAKAVRHRTGPDHAFLLACRPSGQSLPTACSSTLTGTRRGCVAVAGSDSWTTFACPSAAAPARRAGPNRAVAGHDSHGGASPHFS